LVLADETVCQLTRFLKPSNATFGSENSSRNIATVALGMSWQILCESVLENLIQVDSH
jgi:hypothetical protein